MVRRRYHVHAPGLLYLGLVVAVGVVAAQRPSNLLVWVFAAMLAGVLVSGVLSGWPLMRIAVRRSVPATASAGEPMLVRYEVTQRSRTWPAFAITVRELPGGIADACPVPAFVRHVGPGQAVLAETVAWPTARGPLRFGAFRAETTFPFGLLRKSVTFEGAAECLVLPRPVELRPGALRSLVSDGRPGPGTVSRVGPGSDYVGLREYRPGDAIRSVAWRRSSATGHLTVIERSVDASPRLHVVLDLRRPTAELRLAGGADPRALEEDAIVLAASLLSAGVREGMESGLTVLGLPGARVRVRAGRRQLDRAMLALASLDLDAPRDAVGRLAAVDARDALLVVHVDRADTSVGGRASVHLGASQLVSLAAGGREPAP
jgi:uncharacterized protein (DUF58 family)